MNRSSLAILAFTLVSPAAASPRSIPPVKRMTLEQVEPPRSVPAAAWKSPYCMRWNDGCTECKRAKASDKPRCEAMAVTEGGECKPRPIYCQDEDRLALHRVCRYYSYLGLAEGRDKGSGQGTYLGWTRKAGRWVPQVQNPTDYLLPNRASKERMGLGEYQGRVETRDCGQAYDPKANLDWYETRHQ